MIAKSDIVELPITRPHTEAVAGARPEPEELPAKHVIDVSAPATLNTGQLAGGDFKTRVVYETNVHNLATLAGAKCFGCRHWDNQAWRQMYRKMWSFKDGQKFLNNVRGFLIGNENDESDDGGYNLEEEVQGSMGICHPLTERNAPFDTPPLNFVATHAGACCPERDQAGAIPAPFYMPKDMDSRKIGTALYDKVLRLAQGKAPKIITSGKGK